MKVITQLINRIQLQWYGTYNYMRWESSGVINIRNVRIKKINNVNNKYNNKFFFYQISIFMWSNTKKIWLQTILGSLRKW